MRRARPVAALASVAFAIGAIAGAQHGSSAASTLAGRFVSAWTRSDYATMYTDIDPASQRASSASEFASAYRQALRTATATHMRIAGRAHTSGGQVSIPVRVVTRLFGTLSLDFAVTVGEAGGSGLRVQWSRSLTFPGLRPGETLSRQTTLPRRAALLARDGSVLAEGSATEAGTRNSPLGASAGAVIGEVGPIPTARRPALEAQGVPSDAIVGSTGLERALDARLRGTPGGELLAGAASARDRRVSCGERRTHHRLSRGTARRGDRARGTARRDRRDGAVLRTDPCGCRYRSR